MKYWSSSWRWQPHIGVCRLLWPLLRARMAVLTDFFCKMYFLCVSQSRKKTLGNFFFGFTPWKSCFFLVGGPWLSRFPGRWFCRHRNHLSGKVLHSVSDGLSINYDHLSGCPDFQRGGSAGRGTTSLEKCCTAFLMGWALIMMFGHDNFGWKRMVSESEIQTGKITEVVLLALMMTNWQLQLYNVCNVKLWTFSFFLLHYFRELRKVYIDKQILVRKDGNCVCLCLGLLLLSPPGAAKVRQLRCFRPRKSSSSSSTHFPARPIVCGFAPVAFKWAKPQSNHGQW